MRAQPLILRAEDIAFSKRVAALGYLLCAYFLYAWSWNTVDVLRPLIAASLGLNLTQAGSLYSVQALGALAGALINSQLADRIGRRSALMALMAAFGLTLLSGTLVSTYWEVLVQRLLLGYFTGAMYPITVSLYAGLFSGALRGRVAGIVLAVYNLGVSMLGLALSLLDQIGQDWRWLLGVGLAPVLLAPVALLLIPNDRRVAAYGAGPSMMQPRKLPIMELFAPSVRRQTILLSAMTGLNLFSFQAFSGWSTTYLREVRGFSDTDIGLTIGLQFAGASLGGLLWGWIGDQFGRRAPAWGFVAAAGLIVLYLYAPIGPTLLQAVGFLYGVMLSASVVWGPWLAELYPPHLRSTAASIYNWGRVVSFLAPLITARVAVSFGLPATMAIGAVSFLCAFAIWRSLPETMARK